MCEAFRTPEHMKSDVVRKRPDLPNIVTSNSGSGCSRVSSVAGSLVSNGEDVHDDLTNLLHAACIQQSINKGIMFGENSSDDKILLNLPIRYRYSNP